MNKIKIIIFDVDGVLIRLPYYYSRVLENSGYKNATEILNPFFRGRDSQICLEGKSNAEKMIRPYLDKFGWKGTAKQFYEQQFQFERDYLDTKLIALIDQLRKEGVKCYLGTDQEKNRAKYLLNKMDFQNIFDGHFISCDVGYRKCHVNFWKIILKELKEKFHNLEPNEVVFFDDDENNIEMALKSGIQAYLFKNIKQLKKDLALME